MKTYITAITAKLLGKSAIIPSRSVVNVILEKVLAVGSVVDHRICGKMLAKKYRIGARLLDHNFPDTKRGSGFKTPFFGR